MMDNSLNTSIIESASKQFLEFRILPIFEHMMAAVLHPKADPRRHAEVFYHGLRLCGVDGSTFSLINTPQVEKQINKARSRRGQAAFAKVGVAVLVELGVHNPLAAAMGAKQ